MITIKIYTDTSLLLDICKKYNSVLRSAYCLMRKNPSYKNSVIESTIKSKKITTLDSSLIKLAVNQAKSLKGKHNVVFGNNTLFNKLKYQKGDQNTKALWQASRSYGMLLRGSKCDPNGNRKAELDIANNKILIKISKDEHYELKLNLNDRLRAKLTRLQTLCRTNQTYFTLQINDGYVCIIFDEKILANPKTSVVKNRILSIDLNPNYIGLVICDKHKTLYKEIIDFRDLNKKDISNEKNKYEKYQAIKHIFDLASHWHVQAIAIEKLDIKSKNHAKGKTFNRLVNNTWHRNLLINSIKKWSSIYDLKVLEIYAAYSSFVGCINLPNEVDSIAAALEINSRAQKALEGQKYNCLPDTFDKLAISTRWKEMELQDQSIESWKALYLWCKKTKFSYRILLDDPRIKVDSFKINSCKSKTRRVLYDKV